MSLSTNMVPHACLGMEVFDITLLAASCPGLRFQPGEGEVLGLSNGATPPALEARN